MYIEPKYSKNKISCANSAWYIDVKSEKRVQILIGISTKISRKSNFRGGGLNRPNRSKIYLTLQYPLIALFTPWYRKVQSGIHFSVLLANF